MHDVLIDVTRLIDRRLKGRLVTGVDRVRLEYVKHFGLNASALVRFAGQWIELSRKESRLVFEELLTSATGFRLPIRRIVTQAILRSAWLSFSQPRFLFNTGHSGLESEIYVQRLQKSKLRPLFFVHDLIPLTHPEYCREGEAERHRKRMHTVLNYGHGIIANSAATLAELQTYSKNKIATISPAIVAMLASSRFSVNIEKPAIEKPYFVILGTIEPRKNHWLLLHLWRRMVEQMGVAVPRLVIIGQRGWECENVVDMLERCGALRDFVIELPACTDAQLEHLLHHAQALLFPSFAEGFGLPLLEALSLGVPVIASDLPAFREIAGNVPEYLDPLDGKRWEELVIEYGRVASVMRVAQCRRIAKFIAPTWSDHFERVEAFMEQLSFGAA